MIAILSLIIALILTIFIVSILFWLNHIYDVKSDFHDFGWGTFLKFKQEYAMRAWNKHTFAYYSHDGRSRISGSAISFNGKGMLLGYFDYLKFRVWLIKQSYNLRKKPTVKW